MASEKDLELLDNYIGNRMDAAERSAFEQTLTGDPELKQEYQLQSKIAEGIRKARAAELKAMLGTIPTAGLQGGGEGAAIATKVGMWIAASAVVGAGVYFWLKGDEASKKTTEPITQAPDAAKSTEAVTENSSTEQTTLTPERGPVKPAESTKSETKKATAVKKDTGAAPAATTSPKIEAFDPSGEEGAENVASSPEEIVIASDKPVLNKEQTRTEIISGNNRYTFHYQFKNGKVLLYGPFQANLYEIMEFFGGPQQTVFLFHADTYYMMTNDGDKVKPLTPIRDARLIKKLDESRQIK
jgi:hypothetical protein